MEPTDTPQEVPEEETKVQIRTQYILPLEEEEEEETTVLTDEEITITTTTETQAEIEKDVTTTTHLQPEITSGKAIGENVLLPDLPTDRKVCTDYRVYNILGTPHNRMQQLAWTDEQGCRRYGDYYIVGLGSAYADRVGEVFEVELETGVTFFIITGDMKADIHTDSTNRYAPIVNYDRLNSANILEFIIDKAVLDPAAYRWGGVDYYKNFKGNIVRMTYMGRDTSEDWDIYV